MAGSLLIIAGSVLLLLMSSFTVGQEGEDKRLLISDDDEAVPQNPLSLIFVKESTELTIRFGLSFLEELRLLKDSCMIRAVQMEGNFKDALIQLREYRYQTEEVLESSGMRIGMSEEQKQYLRERLNESLNELLDQQDKAKKALMDNCTNEYQKIINDRMRSVQGYANSILLDGGVETYRQFINGIREYGQELQTALDECIELYTPYFRRHNNMRGGSTDTLCMITEVQELIEFIRSYLMHANELLDSRSASPTLTDIQHESTLPLSPSPTPTDNNNNNHHHHGHHGNHHHGHHHHGDHHHGDNHHHHHHHHGGHHHGSNHHGNNRTSIGQLHPTPSTHSRPRPSNVHHKPSSSDLPRPHQPSNKPHPHHSNKPHPHHSNKPHPHHGSRKPRPTAHIDVIVQVEPTQPSISGSVIVDPPAQGLNDHHELSTILIYAGVLSCLFIVSVLMIGGALLCIRYHGNKRKEGWKHLSEEEKVSQMKSSGYVNPTYKFFDQVTQ